MQAYLLKVNALGKGAGRLLVQQKRARTEVFWSSSSPSQPDRRKKRRCDLLVIGDGNNTQKCDAISPRTSIKSCY